MCPCNGLCAAAHLELAKEMFDVCFHRIERDRQGLGNLVIGMTGDQQVQHPSFLDCQRLNEFWHI